MNKERSNPTPKILHTTIQNACQLNGSSAGGVAGISFGITCPDHTGIRISPLT
jgi:hypothetical protein